MYVWLTNGIIAIGWAIYFIGWTLAAVLMVCLGIAGMAEIAGGLSTEFRQNTGPCQDSISLSTASTAIGQVLEGFEFLLLAPLPLVIIVTVARYVRDFLQLNDHDDQDDQRVTERRIHNVKVLVISLMISVLATDLVRRFLDHQIECARGSYSEAIFGGALFALLTMYIMLQFTWLDRK